MGEASCRFWFGEWTRGFRPHGWMVAGSQKDKIATEKVQEVICPPGVPSNWCPAADSRELTYCSVHRNVSRVGGSRGRSPTALAKDFRDDGTAYRACRGEAVAASDPRARSTS